MPETQTFGTRVSLDDLRDLRSSVQGLNAKCKSDLQKFQQDNTEKTFRRLPSSNRKKVNVSTTCTVLMALASNDILDDVYPEIAKDPRAAATLFAALINAEWKSSGLDDGNAFTIVMVLRTAGFLAKATDSANILRGLRKGGKGPSLQDRMMQFSNSAIPSCFKLDITLRETPALGYWLLDAIDNLGLLESHAFPSRFWIQLSHWAGREFLRQSSLVASEHDIMMDPVAMATAACVVQRLRSTVELREFGATDWSEIRKTIPHIDDNCSLSDFVKEELPSTQELRYGLGLFFTKQLPSGIWDKYFPMFYYRDDGKSPKVAGAPIHYGGANYCFAFELLEAILNEFGTTIVEDGAFFEGLIKACRWCQENRLEYLFEGDTYSGWNSGQQVNSLSRGEPESWATGVVHMFLRRVDDTLSNTIEQRVWNLYGASFLRKPTWDSLLDSDLPPLKTTTKDVLNREMLVKVEAGAYSFSEAKRSVLLFGPPGTGKTTLAKAAATRLGWRYIEISPSLFLDKGIENIYRRADDVFRDLKELSRTVILFDEVDALVQTRDDTGASRLDVTQQFLTTSMLPKLAELHDQGQVIFFMATNYFKRFDPAITRPGRFDLLLCIGPPTWSQKKTRLDHFIPTRFKVDEDTKKQRTVEAADLFSTFESRELRVVLELSTRGEFMQLCEETWRAIPTKDALNTPVCRERLEHQLNALRKYMILRPDNDNQTWIKYGPDIEASRIQ